ncbi:hypothetical protein CY0110_26198 [Crocosphaera chwakensis CCY0110]|uniref:Uncharacterized protein n=2 Tax=Crocosphaera TaxID=263510 RepID=A3IPC4_9CHRO|nr:hypothetical protein CY0110_26198 [Crocosphaera chwakensis CCY0110]
MVMVLGTVGTVATAALLARSSNLGNNVETSITIGQQNLSVAETAKVNLQALLIEHNQLLEYNLDDWEKYLTSSNMSEKSREFNHNLRLCKKEANWKNTKERILELAQHKTIDVPMGKFSLLDFQKVDRNEILATIKTQNTEEKQSQYEIDISFSDNYLSKSVPVLWLIGEQQIDGIGNAKVNGNLWANDCSFPVEKTNLMEVDGYQAKYTAIKMPDLPDLEAIKERLPENHYFPSTAEEQKIQDQEDKISLKLPRLEDKPTKKEGEKNVYEYFINNLEDIDSLIVNSDFKNESIIVLYVVGDINISEIVHKCESSNPCSPENLMIVAYEEAKMCLQFDNLSAFIVAPHYKLGIKNNNPNQESAKFTGSIWTNKLLTTGDCGSEEVEFSEAWEWGDLPNEFQSLHPTPKLIQVNLKESIQSDISTEH